MHANVYESNDLKTLIANTLREKVTAIPLKKSLNNSQHTKI